VGGERRKRRGGWKGRGREGRGGERGEDVEGPGKWSAPGPVLALGGPGRAHIPPTKLFPRLPVNKTILEPRVAAVMGAQYLYVRFSRRDKIPRCSAYDIGEINPVPASGSG